jgi:ParB family transcriptional regulator, chromosome partitioning protein
MKNVSRESLMHKTSDFRENPDQPRRSFDEGAMVELKTSIEKYGVLEPILFTINEKEEKMIVAGERRWRASQELKLKKIPAIFIKNENIDDIALVENLFRSDLTPLEEAEALDKLKTKHNLNVQKLAEYLGRPRTSITEILSLNKLPADIKEQCRAMRTVQKSKLISIARMKSYDKQIQSFKKILDKMTEESSLFCVGEIKKDFYEKLKKKANDLDKHIHKVMFKTKKNKTLLAEWNEEKFIEVLNTIVLNDKDLFSKTHITSEVIEKNKDVKSIHTKNEKNLTEKDIQKLNRFLLEEIYPNEVSKAQTEKPEETQSDSYSFINTFSKSLSKKFETGKINLNKDQKENLKQSLNQLLTSLSKFIEKNNLTV